MTDAPRPLTEEERLTPLGIRWNQHGWFEDGDGCNMDAIVAALRAGWDAARAPRSDDALHAAAQRVADDWDISVDVKAFGESIHALRAALAAPVSPSPDVEEEPR